MRNEYTILVRKRERRGHLQDLSVDGDNIKIFLTVLGCEVDTSDLVCTLMTECL
jgi:hypothetical protein